MLSSSLSSPSASASERPALSVSRRRSSYVDPEVQALMAGPAPAFSTTRTTSPGGGSSPGPRLSPSPSGRASFSAQHYTEVAPPVVPSAPMPWAKSATLGVSMVPVVAVTLPEGTSPVVHAAIPL